MKLIRVVLAAAAVALVHEAGFDDEFLRLLASVCRGLAQVLDLVVQPKK